MRALALTTVWIVLASMAHAGGPMGKTAMLERGKVLVGDDFAKELPSAWKVGKGKWEIANGALIGSELAADNHGAALRRPIATSSFVVEFEFALDGAKSASLSINSSKGHLSRLLISPTALSIRKDSSDKNKSDKAAVLDTFKVDLKPGQWHTVVLEQAGKEMVASLDGKVVAYGSHEGLVQPATNFGLTVAGQSASFKNFRVHEGTLMPSWPATRDQLQSGRTKSSEK